MKQILNFMIKYEMIISVIVLIIAIQYFGHYGFWAMIVIYALLALWRLFGTKQSREFYNLMVEQVQMQIWGKPLKKEYWKKDEFKNTKIKWVWWSKRGKENGTTNKD